MANTAHISEASDHPDMSSGSKRTELKGDADIAADELGLDLRTLNLFDESELQKAASCKKRAQILSDSIGEMEKSIHMVRIFLSTSEAVEELLIQSQKMLEMCRQLSDPDSRNVLAETFAEISYHIDDIVEQANSQDQNLLNSMIAENGGNEADSRIFQDISLALTTRALNLPEKDVSFRTDAEIIETAMRVEQAVNKVKTRRAIAEMTLPVLVSRTRIAREKMLYLRGARRPLTKQAKANDEICEYSQWRRAHEPIGSANQNQRDALRAVPDHEEAPQQAALTIPEGLKAPKPETQAETAAEMPLEAQAQNKEATLGDLQTLIHDLDMPEEKEGLDSLTKELARILGIESYLTHWFKYEEGQTGIFTQILAGSSSPALKGAATENYENNHEFKSLTDKYMALFEGQIAQMVEGSTDQMATIDKMLKTEPGKVYATLAKACGRI